MKLIKCYISSFGKFKDFSYSFKDGLNTILADNGWGKSTFACFLKSMFYGLNGTGKHSITENERRKFKPWNSIEKFGGSLEFSYKDRNFKIERFFGNKESEDSLKLFDLDNGKEVDSSNLGARIFGLDENGFLSTVYLNQGDFKSVSNASITAKFNSNATPEDADDFTKAVALLEKKAKDYKAQRGDSGFISQIDREIIENSKTLQSAIKAQETADLIKKDLQNLTARKEELEKENLKLKQLSKLESKKEAIKLKRKNYQEALAEKERLFKQKESANFVLNGNRVNRELLKNAEESIVNLDKQTERATLLKEWIAKEESAKKPVKSFFSLFYLFIILAFTCLVAGAVCFAFSQIILGVSLSVLLCAFVIIGFLLKGKKQTSQPVADTKEQEYLSAIDQINKTKLALDSFLSHFNLSDGNYRQKLQVLEQAENLMLELDVKIKENTFKLSEIEKDSEISLENSEEICNNINVEKALEKNEIDLDNVKKLCLEKENSLKFYVDLYSEIPEILSQETRLKEELEQAKERYKTIEKTLKFLKEADENLKKQYRAPLEESFNKFISLTEGSPDFNAEIDVDFNVSVMGKGAMRSKDYFSEGYKDLLEICKRFALIDVFFSDEKPFVILDDPFCNLDQEKATRSVNLLEKLSQSFQIIYFICHSSRGKSE
ncbi:MAG: hypothetical protein J6Q32_05475 [Clostridia bacterium]|nr:hypothetical protein [Clostridia bacterium]